MSDELTQINHTLSKLCVKVEHIKVDITEMKEEREKHKEKFWINMSSLKDSIFHEKEERIESDTVIEKDMAKLKTKVGIITAGITTGLTAIWQFLKD